MKQKKAALSKANAKKLTEENTMVVDEEEVDAGIFNWPEDLTDLEDVDNMDYISE